MGHSSCLPPLFCGRMVVHFRLPVALLQLCEFDPKVILTTEFVACVNCVVGGTGHHIGLSVRGLYCTEWSPERAVACPNTWRRSSRCPLSLRRFISVVFMINSAAFERHSQLRLRPPEPVSGGSAQCLGEAVRAFIGPKQAHKSHQKRRGLKCCAHSLADSLACGFADSGGALKEFKGEAVTAAKREQPQGREGWDGMGVCPTPARHVTRPTLCVSGLCHKLPRAGLGATQTTTDPVRDWRVKFP